MKMIHTFRLTIGRYNTLKQAREFSLDALNDTGDRWVESSWWQPGTSPKADFNEDMRSAIRDALDRLKGPACHQRLVPLDNEACYVVTYDDVTGTCVVP
jgi:hypothetical protein